MVKNFKMAFFAKEAKDTNIQARVQSAFCDYANNAYDENVQELGKSLLDFAMKRQYECNSLVTCGSTEPTTTETEATETVVETEVEATEEVTEVVEATEVEETTEEVETTEVTEMVEATEVAEATPTYTYTEMNATKYAKSSVNVRDLPSTEGARVGGLSTNQQVKVTGQCNETGWYRIELNGEVAYVSNSYLVNEKVAVATQSTTNNTTNTNTTATDTNTTTTTTNTETNTATQSTPTQTQTQPSVETSTQSTPVQDTTVTTPEQTPVADTNTNAGTNSNGSVGMGLANDNSGTVVTDPNLVQDLIDSGAIELGAATLNPDGSVTIH